MALFSVKEMFIYHFWKSLQCQHTATFRVCIIRYLLTAMFIHLILITIVFILLILRLYYIMPFLLDKESKDILLLKLTRYKTINSSPWPLDGNKLNLSSLTKSERLSQ